MIPAFFKKLLFSRQFFYDKGKFFLMMKVPGIILPMHAFVSFMNQYSKNDKGASKHTYEVGYTQGKNAGQRYLNISSSSFPTFVEFVKGVAEVMGLGKIHSFKKEGEKIYARINPSIFAEIHKEMFGKSKKPVCNYLSGLAAGLFEPFFKYKLDCVETYCKAKGDPECVFVLTKAK